MGRGEEVKNFKHNNNNKKLKKINLTQKKKEAIPSKAGTYMLHRTQDQVILSYNAGNQEIHAFASFYLQQILNM